MSDPSWALQKALFARLREDASLTALLAPHADPDVGGSAVYDAAPQGAAYPYVAFDRSVVQNADLLNRRLDRRFLYLSVWSQYQGQKEVMEIMAAIDEALHEKPLTLETGAAVSIRVERKDPSRDADGTTYMGRVTLRILTTH